MEKKKTTNKITHSNSFYALLTLPGSGKYLNNAHQQTQPFCDRVLFSHSYGFREATPFDTRSTFPTSSHEKMRFSAISYCMYSNSRSGRGGATANKFSHAHLRMGIWLRSRGYYYMMVSCFYCMINSGRVSFKINGVFNYYV